MEYGLSLGSNLGNRLAFLKKARICIEQIPGVTDVRRSNVYETEPVGVRPEYEDLNYLNAVLVIASDLPPDVISDAIHRIEEDLGRMRTDDRFAPRPIDIDMLFAGDTMSDDDDLTLPHPRWAERRFVVQPLADIKPDLVFPGDQRRVRDVLASLPPLPGAKLFTSEW